MLDAEGKATKGVKSRINFAPDVARIYLLNAVWHWPRKVMKGNKIQYMPQSEVGENGQETHSRQ